MRRFDNFDKYSESYHEICDKTIARSGADSNYFSEYKIIEVCRFEDTSAPLRILDFGCGNGNSSVYINKYFSRSEISGIDVSANSIRIAQEKQIANATFKVFDGINLPFKDEEFDIIFTSMVFHHIDFKLHGEVLRELHRVLKKGGRFYSFEHNPKNMFTRKLVRECELDKDAVLLKSAYHKEIMEKSGFSVKDLRYTIFFPRHKIFKIFLRLEKMLIWCPIGAQYFIRAVK